MSKSAFSNEYPSEHEEEEKLHLWTNVLSPLIKRFHLQSCKNKNCPKITNMKNKFVQNDEADVELSAMKHDWSVRKASLKLH